MRANTLDCLCLPIEMTGSLFLRTAHLMLSINNEIIIFELINLLVLLPMHF